MPRGIFQPRICRECGEEYVPASGRQKYCKDCGRPGRTRGLAFRERATLERRRAAQTHCHRPGCHNLLSHPERQTACDKACYEAIKHGYQPSIANPHGYLTVKIVVGFLVEDRSIRELAAAMGLSVRDIIATLRRYGVREPLAERNTDIPNALFRDLRKVKAWRPT